MTNTTAVLIGAIAGACAILGFLGACVGFAYRIMQKLASIERIPEAVNQLTTKLQANIDINSAWHENHIRYDHNRPQRRRD